MPQGAVHLDDGILLGMAAYRRKVQGRVRLSGIIMMKAAQNGSLTNPDLSATFDLPQD